MEVLALKHQTLEQMKGNLEYFGIMIAKAKMKVKYIEKALQNKRKVIKNWESLYRDYRNICKSMEKK